MCTFVLGCLPAYALHPLTRFCVIRRRCACVCTFVLGCLPAYALHALTRFCGRFFVVTDPPSTDWNTHHHDLDAGGNRLLGRKTYTQDKNTRVGQWCVFVRSTKTAAHRDKSKPLTPFGARACCVESPLTQRETRLIL